MLAVTIRCDRDHARSALCRVGRDSGLAVAHARRFDRRGCNEQRQQKRGNGNQTAHRTQGQHIRTISHERSEPERQV